MFRCFKFRFFGCLYKIVTLVSLSYHLGKCSLLNLIYLSMPLQIDSFCAGISFFIRFSCSINNICFLLIVKCRQKRLSYQSVKDQEIQVISMITRRKRCEFRLPKSVPRSSLNSRLDTWIYCAAYRNYEQKDHTFFIPRPDN